MFGKSVPEPSQLAGLSAAELIDAAGATGRAENAACARKLAVMAELFDRRTHLAPEDRLDWWVDPDAAVTAEIAAAAHITQGLALHQTYRGVVLRDRLPKIGAVFLQGLINDMLVRAIINRTALILDTDLIAAVDAELAAEILGWGPMSIKKTHTEIDDIIARHDTDALRKSRDSEVGRTIEFGNPADAPGFTTIWARVFACDAAAGERTLTAMAYSVCEDDPRSIDDRRNDAYAALLQGITTLTCHCGASDCEAATNPRPLRDITLYAITDHTTPTPEPKAEAEKTATEPESTASESTICSPEADRDIAEPATPPQHTAETDIAAPAETQAEVESDAHPQTTPAPAVPAPKRRPAYLFGSGFMPAPLFEAMLEQGAKTREIIHPGQTGPEPRYTPSAALAAFVRCRDLTCRFPGCDKPATTADIDHTVPHPVGPTHPSNLKCLCRFHHLLKTFWGGPGGWRDRQLPDGTIIWTAPTGHTYTTHPGSKTLYPMLCQPTATLWTGDPPPVPTPTDKGDESMPRRRKTRAQSRTDYINAERQHNRQEREAAGEPHSNDPPPF